MPCIVNCFWFPSEVIPVDVSGRSFERMSILRRSCIDCNGGVRRRTGKRKVRGKRRNTIAGTDSKELEAIVATSEEKMSEDICSSGISVTTEKKSHIEYLKEWGRSRLRQIRNLDTGVKLRERAESLARKKWDKDEPQHSSSGNWSASSESGSTVTSHQPRSSISSGSVCNKHSIQPIPIRQPLNSGSSSITSDSTITQDEGETCSTYSCDTEGYYTSFHMDSGLKTLREEEPMAALTTTSALSESQLNDDSTINGDSEYELFGKGSTSTTASSAGTVCTTLMIPAAPSVPERTSSQLSGSRTLPDRKDNNSSYDVPTKTQSLKYDKKLCEYVGKTLQSVRIMNKQNTAAGKQLKLTKENINKLKQLEDNKYKQSVITVDIHNSGNQNSPEKCGDSPDSGHNTCSSPVDSITSPSIDLEMSECSDLEGLDRVERIRSKTTINSSRIPSMCVITPPQSDDETSLKLCGALDDSGDYVTLKDTSTVSDIETEPVDDFGKGREEYVSINELAINENSLERKKKGAKVTLNSEGKVIYSSDSLRRRKKIHTTNTFEPGPYVTKNTSPLPSHKNFILPKDNKVSNENLPPNNLKNTLSNYNVNTPIIPNPNNVRNSPLPSRIRERMTPLGTLKRDPSPESIKPIDNKPLEPISYNRSPNSRRNSPIGINLISPGKQLFSNSNPTSMINNRPLSPLVSSDNRIVTNNIKTDSKVPSIGYSSFKSHPILPHTIVKASNSPLPNRTIKGAYVKMNDNFLETSIDDDTTDSNKDINKKLIVKRSDSYRLANSEMKPVRLGDAPKLESPNKKPNMVEGVTAGENLLEAIQASRNNNKDICEDNGPSRLSTWPRSPSTIAVQSSTPTKVQGNSLEMSMNISPIGSPETTSPNPEMEFPPRMNNIAASYKNVPYTENVRNMLSNIRINELAKSYTPVQTNSQSKLDEHLNYLQNKYPALRKDGPPSGNDVRSRTNTNSPSPSENSDGSTVSKPVYNPYASIRRVPPNRNMSLADRIMNDQRPKSPPASERLLQNKPLSPSGKIDTSRLLSASRGDKHISARPMSPSATDRLFPNPQNRPLSPSQRPTSPSASERLFPNGHNRPISPMQTSSERSFNIPQKFASPSRKVQNSNPRQQSPLYKNPPPYGSSPVRKNITSSVSSDNFYSPQRKLSASSRPNTNNVLTNRSKSPISNLESEYLRSIQKSPSPNMPHSKSEGFIRNRYLGSSSSKSYDSSESSDCQKSSPDVTNHPEQTKSSEPDLINNTQHSLSRFIRNSVQSKSVNYGRNKIQEISKIPDKIKQTSRVEFKNLLNKVGWSSSSNKVSAAERLKAKNISASDRLKERTPTPRKKYLSRSNSSLSSSIHNSSEHDESVSNTSGSTTSVNTVRTKLDFNNINPAKVTNSSRSSSIDSGSDGIEPIPKSSSLVSEQMKAFASSSSVVSISPKVPKSPTLETAL